MSTYPIPDPMQFKLDTIFHNKHVVHQGVGSAGEAWAVKSVLGRGGQGTVWLEERIGFDSRVQLRAVKQIAAQFARTNKTGVMRELSALIAVREYNELFVRLHGWYEDQGGNIFLAMDYMPDGDLGKYIKERPQEAKTCCREITTQLLKAIEILHLKSICHRDLKPQNVLIASITPIRIKLADFGISKSTEGTDLRTKVGTSGYMAPELLGMLPKRLRLAVPGYTTAVDMWALGFLTHQIYTGKLPFCDTSIETTSWTTPTNTTTGQFEMDMGLLVEYCRGDAPFPDEILKLGGAPEALTKFIMNLLCADPNQRPSASKALLHPWIVNYSRRDDRPRPLVAEHYPQHDRPYPYAAPFPPGSQFNAVPRRRHSVEDLRPVYPPFQQSAEFPGSRDPHHSHIPPPAQPTDGGYSSPSAEDHGSWKRYTFEVYVPEQSMNGGYSSLSAQSVPLPGANGPRTVSWQDDLDVEYNNPPPNREPGYGDRLYSGRQPHGAFQSKRAASPLPHGYHDRSQAPEFNLGAYIKERRRRAEEEANRMEINKTEWMDSMEEVTSEKNWEEKSAADSGGEFNIGEYIKMQRRREAEARK